MATYTRRVQTVLSDEQYEALSALAKKTGKAMSQLVREAVEQVYFVAQQQEQRRAALERLLALRALVADWPEMEAGLGFGT